MRPAPMPAGRKATGTAMASSAAATWWPHSSKGVTRRDSDLPNPPPCPNRPVSYCWHPASRSPSVAAAGHHPNSERPTRWLGGRPVAAGRAERCPGTRKAGANRWLGQSASNAPARARLAQNRWLGQSAAMPRARARPAQTGGWGRAQRCPGTRKAAQTGGWGRAAAMPRHAQGCGIVLADGRQRRAGASFWRAGVWLGDVPGHRYALPGHRDAPATVRAADYEGIEK